MAISDILPPRLFTVHGTALYVDPTSGELRHGPPWGRPANARLVLTGAQSQIVHHSDQYHRPIACLESRSQTIASATSSEGPTTPTVFEIVSLDRGWVGLKADGIYLCAEPDGRVTLSKQVCSAWESFLLS